MPFILKKFPVTKGKKIQIALLQDAGLTPRDTNRSISRNRVFNSKQESYKYSQEVTEDCVYVAVFEGHTRGLNPLHTFDEFAIFDKPSNLVIHPNSKKTEYSLLDEIRYHFGENANQAHRIDAETSGLVIVGLNDRAINDLTTMFENKEYKKAYLAIVRGEIKEELTIDANLKKEGKVIGVRMTTCDSDEGKESITHIKPLKYDEKRDLTLVEVVPITGRQHQIRVHLHAIGHVILGDPIYGIDDGTAEEYLNKTLSDEKRLEATGAHRLWLQANYLEFAYKGTIYKIYSKNNDIYNEFGF